MKEMTRNNNFEVLEDRDDWVVIRTSCRCLSGEHILDIELEKDEMIDDLVLQFQYNVTFKDQLDECQKGFFGTIWKKIKAIIKIIFNKEITFEEGFIFRNSDQAIAVCDYIKERALQIDSNKEVK